MSNRSPRLVGPGAFAVGVDFGGALSWLVLVIGRPVTFANSPSRARVFRVRRRSRSHVRGWLLKGRPETLSVGECSRGLGGERVEVVVSTPLAAQRKRVILRVRVSALLSATSASVTDSPGRRGAFAKRPIAADDTRCGFALNRPSRTAPRAWIPSQSVPGDREHTLAVQSSPARPHGHGRGTCESPTSIRARRQPTNGCSAGPERSHNRQRRLQQPDDVLMHIQRLPASVATPGTWASLPRTARYPMTSGTGATLRERRDSNPRPPA